MSFKALDDDVFRQVRRRFECHQVTPAARLCEMGVTGIRGRLRLLVDAHGRVAVIQFRPDRASPAMREEGRRLAARWNLVTRGAPDDTNNARRQITRWRSNDERYTVMMRYGRFDATPDAIEATDRTAVRQAKTSSPLAPLILTRNDILEPKDKGIAEELAAAVASVTDRRAVDLQSATTPPQSDTPAAPLCDALPDVIERGSGNGRAREDFGVSRAVLLEGAVAAAYPGSRLVWGKGTWIVNARGRSEHVRVDADAVDASAGVAAFALQFPSRAAVVAERLRKGDPTRFCRNPAEVLVAHIALGTVSNVYRVALDHEALASSVSLIEILPAARAGDARAIRVRYSSTYGSDFWTGSLEWEGIVSDDPGGMTRRVLLQFGIQGLDGEGERSGTILLTGRPRGAVQYSTLEQQEWGILTRTILVPVDSSNEVPGSAILALIY